ncbi:MAG: flagellar filament capping protein FliD [Lachnospiraceae bacterium]
MANSIMNTVYNQYLTTYAPKKSDTRHDTHKRSELKSICNSIAKVNKDAPLYKFDNSTDMRRYVIDIKENARELHNTILEVAGSTDSLDFGGKIAYSSNDNIVSAKYIGESGLAAAEVPTYEIEVTSLASPQVNLGKYLPKYDRDIPAGEYSFDVTVNGQGYEFQYTINDTDTNEDIQNRLSRLINNSSIGLLSSVEEDDNGNTALKISSSRVGIDFGQNSKIFSISDNQTSRLSGSVNYLGIDYVARQASNAHFKVNGMDASSVSNTFILQNDYEVTLNGVSPEEGITATIGIKADTESLRDNIANLLGGYNQFIRSISEYRDTQERSRHLVQEMNNIAGIYRQEMEKLGISIAADGELSLNEERLKDIVAADESKEVLSSVRNFSAAVLRKSDQISLNPLSYVNKTVVAYKNPGKSFISPYVSSAYAGMMFNSYC